MNLIALFLIAVYDKGVTDAKGSEGKLNELRR